MEQDVQDYVEDLEQVVSLLRASFVGKDELVELMATAAVAQEHLLIVGPPGTAKSALIKQFAQYCSAGEEYFEYLLTRFTEPNEIFGAVDISAFRDGVGMERKTQGMLPQAQIAFLDEVFKANSAILNALLSILNERKFYNGHLRDDVPLISAIGATNNVPDETELAALYDRFLIRFWTDNVEETRFPELFQRGWELEQERIAAGYGVEAGTIMTTGGLRRLYQEVGRVDMSAIMRPYREVIRRIRAQGIRLSDRRVVKMLKLIAASAIRNKRMQANPGDFWVLRHVWNNAEQIPHLQTIVDPYVVAFEGETWRAERSLDNIEGELAVLLERAKQLRTDVDIADFLQQAEGVRRELMRHSAGGKDSPANMQQKHAALSARVKQQVTETMDLLEKML
ncbi:MAG: AAA family ATPase [Candidatus Promineifilaceae bacterium]